MHPRAILIVDVLRNAMRRVPVAARVVPQRAEQRRDRRRRRGSRRRAELVECHRPPDPPDLPDPNKARSIASPIAM